MSGILTRMKAVPGVMLLLVLAACSGGDDKPSDTDIRNAIAFTMPSGIEVSDVEISVSENAGSKVEPLIRDRSKVTLKFTDDFVTIQRRYGDKYILKKIFTKGSELNATAITSSRLKGESWSVHIDRLEMPNISGKALGQYSPDSYAFDGTDEADAIKTAYEEKLAAEQQAREEARAKAEAERQAAIAKAAADKAARIAAFRDTMAGTWVSKNPLMYNGSIYTARGTRETGGIEVTFPAGTEASGVAKVSLYVLDNPLDQLTVDASFKVADDGKSARVTIKSKKLDTLDFSFGGGTWTFDGAGKLEYSRYSNRWTAFLEKDGPLLAQKRQLEADLKKRQAAVQALQVKYKAGSAPSTFNKIGLNNKTYALLYVTAKQGGDQAIYGDEPYSYGTNIALAVIHAGLLKPGEGGVIKIIRQDSDYRTIQGSLRNGVQSQSYSSRTHYYMQLVEKLVVK